MCVLASIRPLVINHAQFCKCIAYILCSVNITCITSHTCGYVCVYGSIGLQ